MVQRAAAGHHRRGWLGGGRVCACGLVVLLSQAAGSSFAAQDPAPTLVEPIPPPGSDATPAPVERLGEHLFKVGAIRVDRQAREVTVGGRVNDAQTLEFVATTKGGFKGYESALELDTNAINFNVALILIGLDRANAVPSRQHFDPAPPVGDPVEIWVAWDTPRGGRRVRAEDLVYNQDTGRTLPQGPWVYTGSVFTADSNAYMAELDGTLIGFVHTPSPIIENPAPLPPGGFGANRLNPALGLTPGTPVRLTVRALPRHSAPATSR
jgi:hypothetical protein